jgi:hypothetical protein
MAFTLRTSIHGRRLGLSSTGGILGAPINSSDGFDAAAQMWGSGMTATTTSTGGATLPNYGVSVIATSATAATFLIGAPVAGVRKEIYVVTSASALTFGGTSTSQVFSKVAGGSAGSTTLTLTDANLAGQSLLLRGLSATKWGVMHGSTVIQA